MHRVIDYIRSLFCKHEYELLYHGYVYYDSIGLEHSKPTYYQWVYVCKKCKHKKKITTE